MGHHQRVCGPEGWWPRHPSRYRHANERGVPRRTNRCLDRPCASAAQGCSWWHLVERRVMIKLPARWGDDVTGLSNAEKKEKNLASTTAVVGELHHALAAQEQAPGTLMKSKADDKAGFIRSLWRGMMPVMSYACCSIYMVSMCL